MKRLLPLLFLLAACATTPRPDLILAGGKVFTADDTHPWAEAIAIRGDRITAVGTNDEIRALARPGTYVIELEGRVVVPGINDAHIHEPWGVGRPSVRIPDDATLERVLALIGEATKQHPAGTFLQATVPLQFVDDRRLDRDALDAVAPNHPVKISNMAGHLGVHNTAALRLRGIAEDQKDTQSGWYGRDANGRLTGWLYEHANWSSDRRIDAARSDDEMIDSMRALAREAVGYGITSVQSMPTLPVERVKPLAARTGIPLRWRFMELQDGVVERNPRTAVKYIVDGTPIERGAAMSRDYADRPGQRGRLNYSDADIRTMIAVAARSDQQLLMHLSGDVGLARVFAAMDATAADWPSKRVRIEHGDLIGGFLDAARRHRIVHVQNPSHFMLPEILRARYGTMPGLSAFRSVLEAGVPVAIGSDGPLNPWLNVFFATLHPTTPAEALTREQAIVAYTRGSAFAEFAEHEKGTLAPGMLADIAVLSQDVFTVPAPELPKTTAYLTIIGGRIVRVIPP